MRILAEAAEAEANRPMHRRSMARLSFACKAVPGLVALFVFVFVLGSCKMSGPVVSMPASEYGGDLFAAHCAPCHGSTGQGDGPAAIALLVRPRDFRNEPFRYVSTLSGVPTREDLLQTIRSGRHFGAMPARPSLSDAEVDALEAYVRETSRVGWVDRLTREFADDDDTTPEEIQEIALERVTPEEPISIPWPPLGFHSDTAIGRELYDQRCASCHGPTGRGDGLDMPKDERGKPIEVRDLTSGEFRGGVAPEEVFKRIRCGVPGTPMPAQIGMSDEEVWQLVEYVQFLAGGRR